MSKIPNDTSDDSDKKSLNEDQQAVMQECPPVPNNVVVDLKTSQMPSEDAAEMQLKFRFAQKIYENVLAPELVKNEELKREQKPKLIINIFEMLKIQFVFTYLIIFVLFVGIIFSDALSLSDDLGISIINFVKFYVTSIVVELLSILFFIVKNIFDKSIVDLIKGFNKND